jgi:hypothetical protein
MKTPSLLSLVAVAAIAMPTGAAGGQAEADFNDMFLGDTRTTFGAGSPNQGNYNTGKGFMPFNSAQAGGGAGEWNNGTGVPLFAAGDLGVPAGVANFISKQGPDVNGGTGVVFTSGTGVNFTRMQERAFAAPLTGQEVWFSFVFRLAGPQAEGKISFNVPSTQQADPAQTNPGSFAISLGANGRPGALALNLSPNQTAASLISLGEATPELVYYDDRNGNGVIDGGEVDLNGNGIIDGVAVGTNNLASIRPHLIIGRVLVNPSGDDVIQVWLNPPNAADPTLQPPTLTATADKVGPGGIFSVGFFGTRRDAPTPAAGPYTNGGLFAVDHFRISDNANALQYVSGNVPLDPNLVIAPDSPASNFNFAGVYGSGNPIVSQPRTVKLVNSGSTQPIQILDIRFQNPTPVFTITAAPQLPLTLAPGQSASISVQASSSTFETLFSNTLIVDTDADTPDNPQDRAISVAATFFTAGSRVNRNHSFDSNLNDWVSDHFFQNTPPIRVTPGFMGTAGMVRLRGEGDVAGGSPDNFSQNVLNGAADWEFAFLFSPLDVSQFANYAGFEPDGELGDRSFQVVIQSDNKSPQPASGTEGKFTDEHNGKAALINLAYLPTGGGLSVYDGRRWVGLGLPMLPGSIDVPLIEGAIVGDGRLDPAVDVVNSYLVRIKGTGFGTPAAKYSVSVSQPNSTTTAQTAQNLTLFDAVEGAVHTPGSYTFTTGDSRSGSGNNGEAMTTSYWIDEVSFYAVQARDPDMSLPNGLTITSHNGITTSGGLSVTNTGFSQALNISQVVFGNPSVFSTTQALPLVVPAGTSAQIPVSLQPAGIAGGNNAIRSTVSVTSDAFPPPNSTINIVGVATTDANVIGNWNFEVPGGDTVGDTDTFLVWNENVATKDVPGLVAGSTTAASVGLLTSLNAPFGVPADSFTAEFAFAIRQTSSRAFNVVFRTGNNGQVNLRYEAGRWEAFKNVGGDPTGWQPVINMTSSPLVPSVDANNDLSLDSPGDTKSVYRLRFSAKGWMGPTPTYRIEVMDAGGNLLAASAPELAFYQNEMIAGGGRLINFDTNNGSSPGFWVDDVKVAVVVPTSNEVRVTGVQGGPGGFTIRWDSGGAAVTVQRSLDLINWVTISENDVDGTHADSQAPAAKAFYRLVAP